MITRSSIDSCVLIDLPKMTDVRGNLTMIESEGHVPFAIKRVYYLYDLPTDTTRAGHAHKNLKQLYIALAGSFDVILDDGYSSKTIHLNRPYQGLYIGSMIWREINNFSSGSVCLALASEHYLEDDYLRHYEDFLSAIK